MSLTFWDCGFESRLEHGCRSLVSVGCWQVWGLGLSDAVDVHPLSDDPVFCLGSTTCPTQYLTVPMLHISTNRFWFSTKKMLDEHLVLTWCERNALCVLKWSWTHAVIHFIKHRTLKFSCLFDSRSLYHT